VHPSRSIAWAVTVTLLAAEQAPIERVTTRLVEVSVVAEDKKGNPIADLTREDFTVLDGGRAEKVAAFNLERGGEAPKTESLPPNTFTNQLEHIAGGAVTAVLFDGLNTRISDQLYARKQILDFLAQVKPEDQVALYALGRGVNVLQDFTNNIEQLREALKRYKPELSAESQALGPGVDAGEVQLGTWLNEVGLDLIDYYAKDRALRTIRTVVAIADHLERVPGRKNLVWVSGGFPLWISRDSVVVGGQNFWPEIERAVRALNRSNLAIYPVDARGLLAPVDYSPERASAGQSTGSDSLSHTMQVLAERTGGKAYSNNNDLGRAFRQAEKDAQLSYRLAYSPTHGEWNGEFREIKIRVNRPGVRLRYRTGYFAMPDEPADTAYRDTVLGAAKWNPIDASRLGLTVRAIPFGKTALDLEVYVEPGDLRLAKAAEGWRGELDVWVLQIGAKDKELRTTTRVADVRLPDPGKRVQLLDRVELLPGALVLRVLARDPASGALGSVSIPLSRVVPAQ
jgi:VWFA-related protein